MLKKATILIFSLLATLALSKFYATDQSSHQAEAADKDLKVLIYSKHECSYCIKAQELLREKFINYEVIELSNNRDLQIKLAEKTGQTTVPYIYINEQFIGGYEDLRKLSEAGKLE